MQETDWKKYAYETAMRTEPDLSGRYVYAYGFLSSAIQTNQPPHVITLIEQGLTLALTNTECCNGTGFTRVPGFVISSAERCTDTECVHAQHDWSNQS